MDKKREFQLRILATFKLEAEENISSISNHLIQLEKDPAFVGNETLFEEMYRSAHSLKGASRAVGIGDIESLCHSFEDVLSAIRNQEIEVGSQKIDLFFQTVDLLSELIHEMEGEISAELSAEVTNHIELLTLVEVGEEVQIPKLKLPQKKTVQPIKKTENSERPVRTETQAEIKSIPKKANRSETVRISTEKLDSFLAQVEEMLPLKLAAIQQAENVQNALNKFVAWNKELSFIHSLKKDFNLGGLQKDSVNANKGNEIKKVFDFFETSKNKLNAFEKDLYDLLRFAKQEAYSANQKIGALLEDVKELLTVPFSILLDGFPKMMRDISKELGKEIEFVIEGDSIEIDRRILEELRNPLTHLLRNSVDYGIETPEIRIQKNKNPKGKITVKIEQIENNKVAVWISDDGPGLNLEKLKKIYLENENISSDENVSENELVSYIFKSGVSTSNMVTDISGRGLGMAIVQETIEQLGGSIQVETKKDFGTTFKIVLPLSIVTFRGVIIKVGGNSFIVPTFKVDRVLEVNKKQISSVKNRATIQVNQEIIPLANLAQVLEIPVKESSSNKETVIVFEIKGKKTGFIIEGVVGEQEVLVKNFNKQLTRVRNILGATVLGTNQVVPVLNVADLYLSVQKQNGFAGQNKVENLESGEEEKSVLIVEDSITSRTLLKNIVETAGYKATLAVDGVDGFTKLKVGKFDIVISDVEMPRMNGFELTAKIREDKTLSGLPVVLVTSLSKPEHREKGVEVGANAYIVKSNFDQNNLLDALERLI